jgi:hypothetical protein
VINNLEFIGSGTIPKRKQFNGKFWGVFKTYKKKRFKKELKLQFFLKRKIFLFGRNNLINIKFLPIHLIRNENPQFPVSIVVSIRACHVRDPGSIPGLGG